MKLGIIGAGSIVPFHLKASIGAGFIPSVICAKPGSKNAMKMAESIKGLEFAYSISDLLDTRLDAILIATPPAVTTEILKQAIKKNIPLLVEKPLTTDLSQFLEIPSYAHDRIILGYNRRHYSTVKKFRDLIQESGKGIVRVDIPELSTKHQTSKIERRTALLENATHLLDLLNFILGSITITNKEHISDEEGIKFTRASFISSNLSIGTISIAYGVPDSPRISMWTKDKSIELSPIEHLNLSIGMKRIEPTESLPIASYRKEYINWKLDNVDVRFKPGFLRQYLEFYSLAEGKRTSFDSASVLDAQKAISLAHELLN